MWIRSGTNSGTTTKYGRDNNDSVAFVPPLSMTSYYTNRDACKILISNHNYCNICMHEGERGSGSSWGRLLISESTKLVGKILFVFLCLSKASNKNISLNWVTSLITVCKLMSIYSTDTEFSWAWENWTFPRQNSNGWMERRKKRCDEMILTLGWAWVAAAEEQVTTLSLGFMIESEIEVHPVTLH